MMGDQQDRLRKQAERKLAEGKRLPEDMSCGEMAELGHELHIHQVELELQNEELRKSQAETEIARKTYQDLWELSPAGHVIIDGSGRITAINHSARRLFGRPESALLGERFSTLVAPGDQVAVHLLLESMTPGRISERLEIGLTRPGGSVCICQLSCHVLKDRSGVQNIQAVLTDITGLQKSHQALQLRSKELEAANDEIQLEKGRLEAMMTALPVGVVITDASGGVIKANRAFEELWGPPLPATHGIEDYHLYKAWWAGSGRAVVPEEWASAVAVRKGEVVRGQLLEIQRFDGSRVFVTNSAAPVRDEADNIVGSAVAIQDISDLRQAAKALRESQARFKLLSETVSTLLTSRDPEVVVNEICMKVMRYLGCHVFFNFLVDEKSGRLRLNAYGGISEQEARKIEWLDFGTAVCGCVARDNVPIIAEDIQNTSDNRTELVKSYGIQAYACHPILSEDRLLGTLSFGTETRDSFSSQDLELMKTVTDHVATAMERAKLIEQLGNSRNQLEARVRERTAELEMKNQELQDFAYIASHDLQEPLRKIVTFGDILVSGSRDALDDEGRDCIDRMQKSAGIMRELLDSLLHYSRVTTRPSPYKKIDLREPVETALSNLEVTIEEKDALVEVGDLPTVEADPVQMSQLFQNIIGNALKFHPEGVSPRVKIYAPGLGKGKGDKKETHQVCVEDNGIGFDETHFDKIFMPFQRLHGKSKYQGVGMGLAICKKIMDRHGGKITAKSEVAKGSTFIITLPGRQEVRT